MSRTGPAAAVPDWVEYTPNSIWIYDTTHFPAAGMAVLIIEDLVSRKWLTEVVSVEETSTQVELAFTPGTGCRERDGRGPGPPRRRARRPDH